MVEIGTLFGRSASVMLLGRDLGGYDRKLFVFDAWDAKVGAQYDLPAPMLEYTQTIDLGPVCKAFEATFSALAPNDTIGAYRVSSEHGLKIYQESICGEEHRLLKHRKRIKPSAKIAVLHIDGNHDAQPVARDVELWSPLLAPGGWVVIDDYCWRYGSGPKAAGDKLLDDWNDYVARSFVIGDCLFLQKRMD